MYYLHNRYTVSNGCKVNTQGVGWLIVKNLGVRSILNWGKILRTVEEVHQTKST